MNGRIRALCVISAVIAALAGCAAYLGYTVIALCFCASCSILCFVCAFSFEKRRGKLLNTAADVISGFPQVSRITGLNVSRRHGSTKVNAVIELNAYSVRGRGEMTVKMITAALKQSLGPETRVSITPLGSSLNPIRRRK